MVVITMLLLNIFVCILNDCHQESIVQHLESDLNMGLHQVPCLPVLGIGDKMI